MSSEWRPQTVPAPIEEAALQKDGSADVRGRRGYAKDPAESNAVLRDIFAPKAEIVDKVEYAIVYELPDTHLGGDVLDVYVYDNGSVSFMAADVSGHGAAAAANAALIKYSIRAYASSGMSPEIVLRNLDRLYLENSAFEKRESFASVFFAMIDSERATLGYSAAGHDLAILARPAERPRQLPVTAPIIGVFEDQSHLFHQRFYGTAVRQRAGFGNRRHHRSARSGRCILRRGKVVESSRWRSSTFDVAPCR